MIETWLSFAIASLILALSPGPDNIFVLTQSVARGYRYGIAIASGLITGCIVHTSIVALGFAVLIRDNAWLFYSIKIAGALYLLYLAYLTFKSPATINISDSKPSTSSLWSLYKKGIIMNLLNPKVTLFFLALLPQFVKKTTTPEWIQIYLLGFIFMAVSLFVFYAIAILGSQAARFIKSSIWFAPAMKWIQIVIFVGIAVAILLP